MPKQGQKITRHDNTINSYDTAEEINGCLNCCQKECRNCSSRRRLHRGMPDFDYELLTKYEHFPSDLTLAKAMNCSWWKVIHHRQDLGLPDPSTVTAKERRRIAKEKMA